MLPELRRLGHLPGSQRQVVELLAKFGNYTIPYDLTLKSKYTDYGLVEDCYRDINEAMCKALIKLWEVDRPSVRELEGWVRPFEEETEARAKHGWKGYMTQSIEVLNCMWRILVLWIQASKALQKAGQILPPEITDMIWLELLHDVGELNGRVMVTTHGYQIPFDLSST